MRIMCLCHFEYVPCTAYRQKYIVLLNLNLTASHIEFCAPVRLARSELMPHFDEGSFENPYGVRSL